VDADGYASGQPSSVPSTLRPNVVDGTVRNWDVEILLPAIDGHLYLGVGAYWADEDGCSQQPDLGSQYASYNFHVVGQ
jgi:hypothetical protein